MGEAVSSSNWVPANIAFLLFMATIHIGVMLALGYAIYRTLNYRAPLQEHEFTAAEPTEREFAARDTSVERPDVK